MSTYINFFMRRADEFIPIVSFSRSSYIYKVAANYAPYAKIAPFSTEILKNCCNAIKEEKNRIKEKINIEKSHVEYIKNFNNSVSDKLEAIAECESSIKDWEEELEDARRAQYFFTFLEDMTDEILYVDYNKAETNKYIYAGIEVNIPTVEDVVK